MTDQKGNVEMKRRLRSPIVWFGGKGNLAPKIIPWFPKHHTYVEPFGGGASLLFAKDSSPVEVYNDVNEGLTSFFEVLRNKEQFEELHRKLQLTPYSKVEYKRCRKTWFEDYLNPVEQARRWYVMARFSFSGTFARVAATNMSLSVTRSERGMAGHVSAWLSVLDMLPAIAKRLSVVQVEQEDFRKILERYDTPNTLFYLDPPYVLSTRKQGDYKNELTLGDHEDLVKLLLNIEGKAILSGYRHFVYEDLIDAGWLAVAYTVGCDAVGRTKASGLRGKKLPKKHQREEMLYISPSCFSRKVRKVQQ